MSAAGQSRPQPPPPQPRTSSVSSGLFQVEVASQRSASKAHCSQAAPDRHHLVWAKRASEEHEINFPHGRVAHPTAARPARTGW